MLSLAETLRKFNLGFQYPANEGIKRQFCFLLDASPNDAPTKGHHRRERPIMPDSAPAKNPARGREAKQLQGEARSRWRVWETGLAFPFY